MAIAMLLGIVALVLVLLLGVDANLSTTEKVLRALIGIIAMAAIVMLGEPLKNFLQERANRFFYGERYDLRQGLLDFGRTLSATTALEPLLDGLRFWLKELGVRGEVEVAPYGQILQTLLSPTGGLSALTGVRTGPTVGAGGRG